jgi:thiamine biosynthesis protein ThiI
MYKFLLRYSSEIFTKSEITKKKLLKILENNLKTAFENSKITLNRDRGFIESEEDISNKLKNVFGISSFSKVQEIEFNSFEQLIEKAYEFFKEKVKDNFKVICKRVGNHNFHSYDVERVLGEKLSKHKKVNVKEPEYIVYIEIRNNIAYLFDEKIKGFGGFPISSQGKGLVLISGGIDSAVSAFLSYKMGLDCEFLFYDLGGNTIDYAFNVYRFLIENYGISSKGKFYYVDFKEIMFYIIKEVKDSYRNIVLKAFFYKIANEIAKKLNLHVIITGESMGQVSTQTLENLIILNSFSEKFIVRPLITFTKEEIISKAMEIGVFDICYKGKEYCALSKHSAITKANKSKLLYYIEKIPNDIIESAINNYKIIEELNQKPEISKNYDILIDLDRLNIEDFVNNLDKLDKSKVYFLKCQKGQLSSIIGKEMEKLGFKVIF